MKKQFIKFSAIALTVAIMAFNSSCGGDEKEEAHTLSVAPSVTNIVFAADGASATSGGTALQSLTFTVTTNRRSWDVSVSPNQTWLTCPKSGNTFTLTAAANFTTTAPTPAVVTITAGDATPITINVSQLAAAYLFLVEPSDRAIVFPATGGNSATSGATNFTVTLTEGTWDVEYDVESWLTVTKSATGFSLSAAANPYADVPEPVTLRVVTNGSAAPHTFNVTQEGNAAGPPKSAVSMQMWPVTSADQTIKLMLSDYLRYDGDGKVAAGTIDTYAGTLTEGDYRSSYDGLYKGYMYNLAYVQANQAKMCPSPWRVPSPDDIVRLDLALGGTGKNISQNTGNGINTVPVDVARAHAEKYLLDLGFEISGRVNASNQFSMIPGVAGAGSFMLTNAEAVPGNPDDYPGVTLATHVNKASVLCIKKPTDDVWLVFPKNEYNSSMTKDFGIPVRCVRDAQ